MIQVTIWNEFRHERNIDAVKAIYPDGIHAAIAEALGDEADFRIRTATLDEPEHGLTDAVLDSTDVLLWWGHMAHDEVDDRVVAKVRTRVLAGMGFIALHSAHFAKPFKALMGTGCSLLWREAGEKERLWNLEPAHPITEGIGPYVEIPQAEMYGERFDIPNPEKVIFISWFQGGEVFRSGCTWQRGHGKVFYFRPGHETYPIYKQAEVIRILKNAVRWARPGDRLIPTDDCVNSPALEPLPESK